MRGVTCIGEIREAMPTGERGNRRAAVAGENTGEGPASDLPCRGAAAAGLGPAGARIPVFHSP